VTTGGKVGTAAAAVEHFKNYQPTKRTTVRQRWPQQILIAPLGVDADGCVYYND
jgi:hypothetical protein